MRSTLRLLERIRADWQDPLLRNAYALLANALGTSLLGFVYWVLAARFYSPVFVGASSALISALLLASTVGQLNLGGALARFLPRSGATGKRLVLYSYSVAGALAVLITLAATPWLVRLTHPVGRGGVVDITWLVMAVLVWCIFALQDHILTGLRQAVWVPMENAVFGILKVGLLVTLASSLPSTGILVSWTVPMAFMLVPVNLLIFRKLLPNHARQETAQEHLTVGKVRRFVLLDYLGSLFNLAATQLLPVLVAARIGAEANGYFYVAWVVMLTLDFALVSVTSSLTVEGSRDQDRLPQLAAALIPRLLIGGLLLALAIFAGAPYVLAIFGPEYSANATELLRLLALGLLPRGAIILWMGMARVRDQVAQIVVVQGVLSSVVLGLSALLISHFNISGVGLAYSIGQVAVALFLLPRLRRELLRIKRPGPVERPHPPHSRVSLHDLTVIIPTRNAASQIERCLESVVRSRPAEIIVVDGLSTDSTLQIVQKYPVLILSDHGAGLPIARTLGAESAHAPYIAFIDADVVLGDGDLEVLLREFVAGGYVGLQAGLRSVSDGGYWSRALAKHHRYGFSRNWFGLALTIFERDQVLDVGFDRRFLSGEDVDLRMRLRDLGSPIAVSTRTFVTHRFQSGFEFARRQWRDDGAGLARVIHKRGLRSCKLLVLPLASAIWGASISLLRLEPHWLPYYACYLAGNYVAMFRELFHPADLSAPPGEHQLSSSAARAR